MAFIQNFDELNNQFLNNIFLSYIKKTRTKVKRLKIISYLLYLVDKNLKLMSQINLLKQSDWGMIYA